MSHVAGNVILVGDLRNNSLTGRLEMIILSLIRDLRVISISFMILQK